MTLLGKLIKVAHENPETQADLLPLIKEAMQFKTPDALKKYLDAHPKADKSKHTVGKPFPTESLRNELKNDQKKKKPEDDKKKPSSKGDKSVKKMLSLGISEGDVKKMLEQAEKSTALPRVFAFQHLFPKADFTFAELDRAARASKEELSEENLQQAYGIGRADVDKYVKVRNALEAAVKAGASVPAKGEPTKDTPAPAKDTPAPKKDEKPAKKDEKKPGKQNLDKKFVTKHLDGILGYLDSNDDPWVKSLVHGAKNGLVTESKVDKALKYYDKQVASMKAPKTNKPIWWDAEKKNVDKVQGILKKMKAEIPKAADKAPAPKNEKKPSGGSVGGKLWEGKGRNLKYDKGPHEFADVDKKMSVSKLPSDVKQAIKDGTIHSVDVGSGVVDDFKVPDNLKKSLFLINSGGKTYLANPEGAAFTKYLLEVTGVGQSKGKDKKDDKKAPEKKPAPAQSKYNKKVQTILTKNDLIDDDADEVKSFKKKKPTMGNTVSDAELMRRFLAKAKPETKERMKGMSPADFMKILGAITDDEEGDGGKQASMLKALQKVANDNPETRKHLIPLLKSAKTEERKPLTKRMERLFDSNDFFNHDAFKKDGYLKKEVQVLLKEMEREEKWLKKQKSSAGVNWKERTIDLGNDIAEWKREMRKQFK